MNKAQAPQNWSTPADRIICGMALQNHDSLDQCKEQCIHPANILLGAGCSPSSGCTEETKWINTAVPTPGWAVELWRALKIYKFWVQMRPTEPKYWHGACESVFLTNSLSDFSQSNQHWSSSNQKGLEIDAVLTALRQLEFQGERLRTECRMWYYEIRSLLGTQHLRNREFIYSYIRLRG